MDKSRSWKLSFGKLNWSFLSKCNRNKQTKIPQWDELNACIFLMLKYKCTLSVNLFCTNWAREAGMVRASESK